MKKSSFSRILAVLTAFTVSTFADESATVENVAIPDSDYRYTIDTIDTTEAPDLTEWSHHELVPVMTKWYPLIVAMLPSEGFTAPKTFSITFTDRYQGVAATSGNRIECSPAWYRTQLKGEALGSLIHELVHVAQQYRGPSRPPGWLQEGIPDYLRWYLYEPEAKGCEIPPRRAAGAKHDASYRVSANFLNFVIGKYDKDFIKDMNAALRESRYDAEIWKTRTGKTVEELAAEWRKSLEAAGAPQEARKRAACLSWLAAG